MGVCRTGSTGRRCVAAIALSIACLLSWHGRAQVAMCVTPTGRCQSPSTGAEGTACKCPSNPQVWGVIVTPEPSAWGEPERRPRRRELRNDDLDEDDDVLAGPRHHRHRHDLDSAE